MQIQKIPENAENVIDYEITGNVISFNDDELALNLKKRERDGDVHIDICSDRSGALVIGTAQGLRYVAQIDIPARAYEDVEVEENGETITRSVPVPFDIDRCTLTLWEMEE